MDSHEELIAAIDVGASKTRWGLVSLQKRKVLVERAAPTVVNPARALEALASGVRALITSLGWDTRRLSRVVVGVPGMVGKNGRLYNAFNLPTWEDLDFHAVGDDLGCPIQVTRDITLATLGEWHALPDPADDLAVVYIGSGVGVGLVVGGNVQTGAHGVGGELGHWTVVPGGDTCSCGKRGCLETVASGRSLRLAAEQLGFTGPDAVAHLLAGWRQGNPTATAVVERTTAYLGMAIGNLWKLVDPAHIVLGGGVIDHAPDLVPLIAREAQQHGASRNVEPPEFSPSRLGNLAPLLGGIWLVQ